MYTKIENYLLKILNEIDKYNKINEEDIKKICYMKANKEFNSYNINSYLSLIFNKINEKTEIEKAQLTCKNNSDIILRKFLSTKTKNVRKKIKKVV